MILFRRCTCFITWDPGGGKDWRWASFRFRPLTIAGAACLVLRKLQRILVEHGAPLAAYRVSVSLTGTDREIFHAERCAACAKGWGKEVKR
jgi:hypothetical protein